MVKSIYKLILVLIETWKSCKQYIFYLNQTCYDENKFLTQPIIPCLKNIYDIEMYCSECKK